MTIDDRSAAVGDFEALLESELLNAPRTPTSHLFHYTGFEAVRAILAAGTLRLSPYTRTNDLWESQPHYPTLSAHHDESSSELHFALWNEIDRQLRLHTKVGCLTQDLELPPHVLTPDALRGWAHLALWAHYGNGHQGVCLRFDRERLLKSFLTHAGPTALAFHGPVRYLSNHTMPITRGIGLGQASEFGADAVTLAYAEANKDQIFFRKHSDWSSEAEFRLVLLNQSVDVEDIDIRDALTGVIVGSAFPPDYGPELLELLAPYPDVSVEQIRFHNRMMFCTPFEIAAAPQQAGLPQQPLAPPRREGTLAERLQALREVESDAKSRREAAVHLSQDHLAVLEQYVTTLRSQVSTWPRTEVNVHSHIMAVPVEQRAHRAGVAGEAVHFERGFMCVAENLPKYSHTLVAAAAVQVLDHGCMRLHAAVTIENWFPDGNKTTEYWRTEREMHHAEVGSVLPGLLDELSKATHAARETFDDDRGMTPANLPVVALEN